MDNLSAQQKLMGNMQATSAELLSGIMEERAADRGADGCLRQAGMQQRGTLGLPIRQRGHDRLRGAAGGGL